MRRSWLALPVLVVVSVTQSFTASNVLPPSRAGKVTQAIDANALKPDDCALLNLSAVVTSGTGTAANDLVLGDNVANTLTGGDGDDCLVAGDGDDTLDGGPGIDVCIGGAGTDTYVSCETQIESGPSVPTAPSGLSAAAISSSQIDLSWTDNSSNEDGFKIERSPGGLGTWAEIDTVVANVTTYSSTGLSATTTYDYRVRAYNGSANSSYSNTASATTNASCASPGTQTVTSNADTYLYEGAPTFNDGTATAVYIQSQSGGDARTLVNFALPSIPAGCSVTGATLRLNASGAAAGRTLEAYRAAASWTETGATWSNQPATTGTAATTTSGTGWREWAVKTHVQAMYSGTNNGFLLRDQTENAGSAQLQTFSSREGANDPELVITFGEPPSPPNAPSGLTATAASSSRIDLTWTDNSATEDGFRIERSPDGQNTWAEIGTNGPDDTTYSDTGLTANTTYDYRVRAYNVSGNSAYSNVASATTGPCSTNNQTVTADRDALVSQSFPTSNFGTLTFLRARSQSANNARSLLHFALPSIPAGCSLSSATLRLNSTATASGRIIEVFRAGASWTETGVTWNTQPATAGSAATMPAASGWVDWIVTSQVEAMYSGSNDGFLVRDNVEDSGTAMAQDYSSREGADAPQLVLTFGNPPPAAPAAPTALSATTASSTQIDLAWTDNSSAEDGFKIERSPGGQNLWVQIATTGANATTYSDTGLAASTTYDYRVRAFNGGGDSAYSSIASATTLPPPPPDAPTALSATAVSSSQIDLSWTDNATNEDGFKIERSPGGEGTWTEIATVGANTTTYSNTGLSASTTYDYRVRAYNSGGDSAYSNVASATTGSCSSPGTQTVAASKDSWIQSNDGNKNNGGDSNLYVQTKSGENWRTMVGFTFPSIPAGCSVTTAKLRLRLDSTDGSRTIQAFMAGASWTETGVTWNNQPATTGTAVTSTTGSSGSWQEWTVTQHVIDMYAGTNDGWMLRDQTESSGPVKQTYKAREGGSSTDPELVITFG